MIKEENGVIIDKILSIDNSSDLRTYVNIVYEIYENNISTRNIHQENITKVKMQNKDLMVSFDNLVSIHSKKYLHIIRKI